MSKLLTILVLLAVIPSFAGEWTIDKDHSNIGFTVRHIVSKVKGKFGDFSGTIKADEKDPSKSKVSVKIVSKSIDTANEKRDTHLKSADFFDVEKYPEIKFESKSVKKVADGKFKLEGTLSMHGVDKPITMDMDFLGKDKDPWGNMRAGFSASTTLNRKDFKIVYNKVLESGGVLVGDDVMINIEIEAIEKK